MTLAPLLAAPATVQIHVAAAVSALLLGALQLAAPKGTIPHRIAGWIWAGLIVTVAGSSFFIHTIRVWGPWSPLHLLAVFTPVMLVRAVIAARQGNVRRHRIAMAAMFGLGLVLPSAIAFRPGRLIGRVFAGPAIGYEQRSFTGPDGRAIDLAIWSPAGGAGLPLIVISHGTGGNYSGHADTAQALAEAGFVVAAPNHPGDTSRDRSDSFTARGLSQRPGQLSAAIDFMLTAWAGRTRLDPARIGVFGHSAGGYTALAAAGAAPDFARAAAFCRETPSEWGCERARARRDSLPPDADAAPPKPPVADARIKAIVIAAPAVGYAFAPEALSRVAVPVQLWEAADDRITPNAVNSEIIRAGLPTRPDLHLVPAAGHFDFLAPCDVALAARVPQICESAPGFDRAAFHRQFNRDIAAFFAARLEAR
ncbi:MAG TPA: alpha/beta fold hydrolase [Stellaceae bacterium]|nr:alpha/beta fold hydrolase [Stellaceae bacterium]